MTPDQKKSVFAFILISAFLALGAAYALRVPLWLPYDEPHHFTYIDILAREGRLPKMEETYEAYQPPLYYAVLALAYPRGLDYEPASRALRIISLLFAALAVGAVYAALKRAAGGGDEGAPLFGAFSVAMIPQFLCVSASITNDTFAILFAAIAFYGMFRGMKEESVRWDILAAVATGLALWSKPLNIFLVPLLPLCAWLKPGGTRNSLRRRLWWRVYRAAIMLGVALLIGAWWYMRTYFTYGDLTGSGYVVRTVYPDSGRLVITPASLVQWLADLFAQFWTFNNFLRNLPPRFPRSFYGIYLLFSLFTAAGTLKAAFCLRRMADDERRLFILSTAAVALVFAGNLYNCTQIYSPSGRYLFVALAPMGWLIIVAQRQLVPPRLAPAFRFAWCAVFALISAWLVVVFFTNAGPMPFAPPFV